MQLPRLLPLVLISVSATALTCQAQHRVLRVPRHYPTISAAISAASAGDTVRVDRGVYREQVVVDVPIRLEGAGRGHTIIDGENRTDLPSIGQVRLVAAGDIEFSGFSIINPGQPGTPSNSAGIYAESPTADVTYSIHHNQVTGTNDPSRDYFSGSADFGILSLGGREHLILSRNQVSETGSTGISIQNHTGPTTIAENFAAVSVGGTDDAIWLSSGDGVHVSTRQRIYRNAIDAGGDGAPLFASGTAVVAGWPNGVAGGFSDVRIERNLIFDVKPGHRGINIVNGAEDATAVELGVRVEDNVLLGTGGYIAITLWGFMDGVRVENNYISGFTGEGIPAPAVSGIRLRGGLHTTPSGTFEYNGLGPINSYIADNVIVDSLRGVSVEGDASNNLIIGNRVDSLGFPAVELGADTTSNGVFFNYLRTPLEQGDDAVLDLGVDNVVRRNHGRSRRRR